MSINGLSSITAATDRSGLVLIAKTDFSAASTVSVDNCFTSAYDNYRIVITGNGSVSSASMLIRMRASGADATGANYYQTQNYVTDSAGPSRAYGGAQTSGNLGNVGSTAHLIDATVARPALTVPTHVTALSSIGSANVYLSIAGGIHEVSTAYDGFTLLPGSGTITGTVRVYGYRNNV